MGEFIKVEIDLSKCKGKKEIAAWVQVCPVNIFKMEGNLPAVYALHRRISRRRHKN
jgi:NAD-dependent dihydropyrimidine dehydrogenase PreA subunit